mmetsp:Transcript_3370/g.9886  ORF Transcript_3370/g.9886 Transcript_3370/m.9886 type:complete len:91 (+) Transcript_3370:429-701(+)
MGIAFIGALKVLQNRQRREVVCAIEDVGEEGTAYGKHDQYDAEEPWELDWRPPPLELEDRPPRLSRWGGKCRTGPPSGGQATPPKDRPPE